MLQLEELTLTLLQRLSQTGYEELLTFAEKREELIICISSIKVTLEEQDKKKLRDLSDYDGIILGRMEQLKREASDWLLKREAIKDQKSAYNLSYTPESMFFDRKN